jgi:hypothetical protein
MFHCNMPAATLCRLPRHPSIRATQAATSGD